MVSLWVSGTGKAKDKMLDEVCYARKRVPRTQADFEK